jgi:hypothetical protein
MIPLTIGYYTIYDVASLYRRHGSVSEDVEYQRIKVTKISDEVGEETAQVNANYLFAKA